MTVRLTPNTGCVLLQVWEERSGEREEKKYGAAGQKGSVLMNLQTNREQEKDSKKGVGRGPQKLHWSGGRTLAMSSFPTISPSTDSFDSREKKRNEGKGKARRKRGGGTAVSLRFVVAASEFGKLRKGRGSRGMTPLSLDAVGTCIEPDQGLEGKDAKREKHPDPRRSAPIGYLPGPFKRAAKKIKKNEGTP